MARKVTERDAFRINRTVNFIERKYANELPQLEKKYRPAPGTGSSGNGGGGGGGGSADPCDGCFDDLVDAGNVSCLGTDDSLQIYVVKGLSGLFTNADPEGIDVVIDDGCTWISDTLERECEPPEEE